MLGVLICQNLRYLQKIVVVGKSFFNYQSGGSQYQILKESHLTKTVNLSPLTDRQKHLPHSKYFEWRTKPIIKAPPPNEDLISILNQITILFS